jgi:hypothetical protein
MGKLWMGIVPDPEATRILVTNGSGTSLLKARLPHSPQHPRALATLCEALALWCARPIHAALAVDGPGAFCATHGWLETFDQLSHSPLFEIAFVENPVAPGEYDERDGLGDFDDLRRLLRAAVAR